MLYISLESNESPKHVFYGEKKAKLSLIDCRPKMTLLPPPLGNFADIVYLKEQSFLHRIRDVCTL